MSNVIYGVIAVILLLVMIFYKIWIGAALAAIGFIGYAIIYSADKSLIMVASEAFSQIGNYSFATVILFTYMGCIIAGTGLGDDLFKALCGKRLDVGVVRHAGVRHDGGGVGIHQNDVVTFGAEGLAGLGAGVVELAGLADDDGA